jgi:hypothetical protein
MSTGDERLDAVSERIDEARQAADRVEEAEELGVRRPDPARDHDAFQPSGDDGSAGENPSEGLDADAPGEVRDRVGDGT